MGTVLVKEYKLRDGSKHIQNGVSVVPGDSVWLTQTQATAFRDKFIAVDTSGEFEEKEDDDEDLVYKPSSGPDAEKPDYAADDKDAPQGQPVVAPAITVPGPTSGPQGPVDASVLDPARQGQQSREQRKIIDSGKAPVAKVYTEEAGTNAGVTTGAPASSAPAGATTAPAAAPKPTGTTSTPSGSTSGSTSA